MDKETRELIRRVCYGIDDDAVEAALTLAERSDCPDELSRLGDTLSYLRSSVFKVSEA